jgi:hypothetical protein
MKTCLPVLFFLIVGASFIRAADNPAPAVAGPTVVLPPFLVQDTSLARMGATIRAEMERDGTGRKVKAFVVDTLEPGSRFKKAGMQVGDDIVRINGTVVKGLDIAELMRLMLLKKGQSAQVVMEVRAKGATATRTMKIDAGSSRSEKLPDPSLSPGPTSTVVTSPATGETRRP